MVLVAAFVAVVALTLSSCGSSGEPERVAVSPTTSVATATADADKPGGTLRMVTDQMPSGDPGWAVTTGDRALARLLTRQLYAYPADSVVTAAVIPRPDLAAGAPTVTGNGTVYTVRLRSSVRWDTPVDRRITASDVARGIKRLCTAPNPSPLRGYFAATLVGFTDYCTELAGLPAAAAKDFIESRSPDGIVVLNDVDIAFHLIAPVNDFVDVLALPAAAPVPFEALDLPPDSPAYLAGLISDGPYRITSVVDGEYRLSRNPVWNSSVDPIRRPMPDHITIRTGVDQAAAQAQIEAGTADMALDATVPTDRAVALDKAGDSRLSLPLTGSTTLLAVGFNGPSAAALRVPTVRAALVSCVDRATVAAALGGGKLAQPATQLLSPTMTGYTPMDVFPDAGPDGDPGVCQSGLAATPGGPVTALSLLTTDSPRDAAVAAALRTAFARSGVRLDVQTRSGADFAAAAVSPAQESWDLALTTITPLWYGDAGRAVFEPLLDTGWVGIRPVDGGYRRAEVPGLVAAALRATDETVAAANWAELERTVLEDVAFIPLAFTVDPRFHSTAVQSFTQVPSIGTGDPAAVSLGPA